MSDVEAAFDTALRQIYQEAAPLGYQPARFLERLENYGSVGTAHAIIADRDSGNGFKALQERQRLDLSVEALVLKPEFAPLFDDETRARARARLREVDYTAPWDTDDAADSDRLSRFVWRPGDIRVISRGDEGATPPDQADPVVQDASPPDGSHPQPADDAPPVPPTRNDSVRSVEAWQAGIETLSPFVRDFAQNYPAWLTGTFGNRVTFFPSTDQRFSVSLDGLNLHWGRLNKRLGISISLIEVSDPAVLALLEGLSTQAGLLRDRRGVRFTIQTESDYGILKDVIRFLGGLSSDDEEPLPGDAHVAAGFREWREGRTSQHPVVRHALDDYPAWLAATFGDRIELRFYGRRPEVGVLIGGRWHHFVTFNEVRNGLYVLIDGLTADDLATLRSGLSRPESLREREYTSKVGMRFYVETDDDYTLLKEIVTRALTRALAGGDIPPQPLDGPAFVIIHSRDDGQQQYGASYTFSTDAGGAPRQLLTAAQQWDTGGGGPLYLILYRPWPHRAYMGWARVTAFANTGETDRGKPRYLLRYDFHPFAQAVDPKLLTDQIAWLRGGLKNAVRGISIRQISADDFATIVTIGRREAGHMTIADAAFLVLTRSGGGPLHLSDILTRMRAEGLATQLDPSPETSLSSALRQDDRFQDLGRNTWILAPSSPRVGDGGVPNVWARLAAYVDLARAIRPAGDDTDTLVKIAHDIDSPSAESLDGADLVADLMQLRLIEAVDATRYRARDYVNGDDTAILRLCALALLVPLEGSAEHYTLPARAIAPRLRAEADPQPIERFAPELGAADSVTLASWYAEAGLITVVGDEWEPIAGTLDSLPGADPASRTYNQFLQTLLADLDGTLTTDLAHVPLDAPLPPVEGLDDRLRELGQDLLFDTAVVRRIYRSLLAGRHVVLSGPPGTGKTELARRLPALLWRESVQTFSRLSDSPDEPPVVPIAEQRQGYASIVVTATEDWGVRDVVGGIGPKLDGQSGALSYTIEHGALTRTVLLHYDGTDGGRKIPQVTAPLARRDYRPGPRERYRGAWLVIDEFTRAPIDAAFGSLLTTLSGGQRATIAVPTREGEIREVPLPRDFRIIGTLNSFDRHFLNQMSEAMKRRFDFIDVLPPPPSYAAYEQGIAAKEALRRMRDDGATDIAVTGDPAIYRWPGVLRAEPVADAAGLRRYQWAAESSEAGAAMTSCWRIFSAIRVFRQLGTAQVVAVYLNLLTGVRVGMDWDEALDTALADALADQLQVLTRDEQRILDAYLDCASDPAAFCHALDAVLMSLPLGRRPAVRAALREADQSRSPDQTSDIALDGGAITPAQAARVVDLSAPLALPPVSSFRRRIRDLLGERGL